MHDLTGIVGASSSFNSCLMTALNSSSSLLSGQLKLATATEGTASLTPSETSSGSNGSFTVDGGHTYVDEYNFSIGAELTDATNNTDPTISETIAAAESGSLTPIVIFGAGKEQHFVRTVAICTDSTAT